MSGEVVVQRGGYSWTQSYVGLSGEITADMDNGDLLLQDGANPGQWRFPNRDNLDARYQGRSAELDGLTDFDIADKGWLVRLGPATYVIRSLTVNGDQLKLTNGNGLNGNPLFEFAAEIKTQHTWSAQQTFTQPIKANAGIEGQISGNVIGDVTGDLIGDSIGHHIGPVTGDVVGGIDARGQAVQFDDESIPVEAIGGLTELIAPFALFSGAILMFAGTVEEIPAGWFVCDGANGTPDLRDRFILASGPIAAAQTTGGAATHTHVSTAEAAGVHNHTVTVDGTVLTEAQMPSHKHGNGVVDNVATLFNHGSLGASPAPSQSIESNGDNAIYEGYTTNTGGGQAHNHSASSANAGSHTHTINVEEQTHIPPYYALLFIMKGA